MAIKLQGYVFKDDGTAVSGASVQAYDSADDSTEGSAVVTNSDGRWTYADISADGLYNIKVSSGGSARWRMGEDKTTFKELYIRNNTSAAQSPLYIANATDAASVKVLDLSNKRVTANVADNDEIYMSFNMQDSAGNADEFARITAIATDVTNDTEDGALVFYVADSDNNGNLQEGFRITSSTGGTVSATTTSASQFNNTITVGVDDTGYDVKFFGATASAYMLWDEDVDDLILAGAARIVIPEGQLVLGSTAVSSTATELNLLDGVSGLVQGDFTKLAAVDSTAVELNLMDGGTTPGTTAIIDGTGIVTNHAGTMGQTTAVTLAAYLDDEITAMPNLVVDSANYANGSIDNAHIADDQINSEHYADGSVNYAHIQDVAANSILGRDANSGGVLTAIALATTQILIGDGTGFTVAALSGAVTMANTGAVTIANNAIDSDHYVDGSIDNAHLADNAVGTDEIADSAVTIAKMAGGTDGNIISYNSSGVAVAIATGSDGQVLTSAGAGQPPAFEDAAAGGASAGQALAFSIIF